MKIISKSLPILDKDSATRPLINKEAMVTFKKTYIQQRHFDKG